MNLLLKKTLVSFGAGRSTFDRRTSARRYRDWFAPSYRYFDVGFRPSRTYH